MAPSLLPSLQGSCFDHPLHQGLHPTRRRSSPTSAPTPKLSKRPKVHVARDMFPTDWSPPPVEFLNRRVPPAGRGTPVPRWVGVAGPQGPRTWVHQLPEDLEQEPQDSDPQGSLASLEDPLWNMAGPSRKAAAPAVDPHTSVSQWLPWSPLLATLPQSPLATPFLAILPWPYPICPSWATSP